jgi:hypothetical protein
MKKILIPALCALLCCACASVPARNAAGPRGTELSEGPRPGWVDGNGTEFPRSRFLTGIGVGDDQASAMERSRGEISRIFSTQVTMNTMVNSSEQESSLQGKTSSSYSQDVSQAVRSTSQKALEGTEIARAWRDKTTGQYYALAILDRAKALAAIGGKLEDIDGQVRPLAAGLAAEPEKLAKIKNAMKLKALLKGRKSLEADLRVLDPSAGAQAGFDVNGAADAAQKALASLDVAVVMAGDASARVQASVIKALNAMGLDAKTSPAGADIIVDCAVEFAPVPDTDPQSRWKWSRGSASVAMKDVKTAKVFLDFSTTAKEASSTGAEARARAEASLGLKIGEQISQGISAYFENQ